MELFGLLLTVPLLLLVMPRAAYPWTAALVVPLLVLVLWAIGRPMASDNDWGPLDAAIYAFGIMLVIGAAILRGVAATIWAFRAGDAAAPPLDWTPLLASTAAALTFGFGWAFAPWLTRLIGTGTAIIIVVAVALAALVSAARRLGRARDLGGRGRGWVALSVALTLLTGTSVSLAIAMNVVRAAERFAAGHPYCVLIAAGNYDNRAARSLLDLTPLTMRAREEGTNAYGRHAEIQVSVRGTTVQRFWSYMDGQFNGSLANADPTPCPRTPHFAANLEWFSASG